MIEKFEEGKYYFLENYYYATEYIKVLNIYTDPIYGTCIFVRTNQDYTGFVVCSHCNFNRACRKPGFTCHLITRGLLKKATLIPKIKGILILGE